MLKPSDIRLLATMTQRHSAGAIKLAAALLERQTQVSEKEIKSLLKMDDLAYVHFKEAISPIFVFRHGKISFPTDDDAIDPWDLITDTDVERSNRALEKLRTKRAPAPLTPAQQRLFALGGMTERQCQSFWHSQTRIYGAEAVVAAIEAAEAAKPGDPRSYIIATLRRRAQGASSPAAQSHGRRFPTRIRAFERPVNPEAATTVLIGWEAPQTIVDGAPVWPTGQRRRIHRLRTGQIHYETPDPSVPVPSHDEDPGFIVVS